MSFWRSPHKPLWSKFEKSTMKSLQDMVNIQFLTKGQGQPVTLTFGEGHLRSCHFEGLPTSPFGASLRSLLWIVSEIWSIFNFWLKVKVNLWPWPHLRSCNFEGLPTSPFGASLRSLLWIVSEYGQYSILDQRSRSTCDLDLTRGHVILKVSPQATFGPSLRSLLWIVSEIWSIFNLGSKVKVNLQPWPLVKVIQGRMILKVSPLATFGLSLRSLLWIVSEIWSIFNFWPKVKVTGSPEFMSF